MKRAPRDESDGTDTGRRSPLTIEGAIVWILMRDGRALLVDVVTPINARGIAVVKLCGCTTYRRVSWSSIVRAEIARVERWSEFSEIARLQASGSYLRAIPPRASRADR